jgi:two-component system LytT family response regulator
MNTETKPTIQVLIVDDEPLARQRIRQMIADEPGFAVAGEAGNGLEALTLIESLHPDLVFLDIQMPELDGFGVIEAIGAERMPPTLFVTAFDAHALKAFEVHAMDYLLKPFNRERFKHALNWIRDHPQALRREEGGFKSLMQTLEPTHAKNDRFLVKSGEKWVLVRMSDIQWVVAEENYVRIQLGNASHLIRQTMAGILTRLDPQRFKRIHRSTIVNLDFVQELHPWNGGDLSVIMQDGTRLTLSRTYRNQFTEWK